MPDDFKMWIGLTGRKQAGKSTVARILEERFGYRQVAFADPVRAAALAIDPYVWAAAPSGHCPSRLTRVVEQIGWDEAKQYPDVRRLLQRVGTEMGREMFGRDCWVNMALNRAWDIAEQHQVPIVFPDVRFPNEANAITGPRFGRCAGDGVIVRVVRPGLPDGDEHPSETAMDNYPSDEEQPVYELVNDGSLAGLEAKVVDLMGQKGWP